MTTTVTKKIKKSKRHLSAAVAHVKSSFNNTMVTITTPEGDVVLSASAGKLGYKGSRKGTPFAASQVANALAKDMHTMGIKTIEINLQGPGAGRDSVVRAFQGSGLHISVLRDVTPLPHNGTRAPKKRRV